MRCRRLRKRLDFVGRFPRLDPGARPLTICPGQNWFNTLPGSLPGAMTGDKGFHAPLTAKPARSRSQKD